MMVMLVNKKDLLDYMMVMWGCSLDWSDCMKAMSDCTRVK